MAIIVGSEGGGVFCSCMIMKNSIVVSFLWVSLLGVFFVGGCDLAQPKNKDQRREPIGPEGIGIAEVPQDPPEQNAPKNEPEHNEDNTVTVKAEAGAGVKGSSYAKPTGGPMDIITVPIAAGFRARERISFMLIDDAMNKFKAEHDRVPESHAEFMDKIIRAGGIILPQLPTGQEYAYDPKDGELKVRKPRNAP